MVDISVWCFLFFFFWHPPPPQMVVFLLVSLTEGPMASLKTTKMGILTTITQQHIFSALQWRALGLFLNRGHLRQCRWA